ncbi:hypothetical protein CWI82_08645 [Pseudidiomarina tainanensis]|uniref:Uncharacterized protein n=1 Tax=Pseudidiomarina tainanensis TaxID=502365 RepID=A0ACD2HG05_9GAMM|nr:DUF4468 domain-containing protein [Pseudidiomarina tainanensis]RZQ55443.1 hypothetical protein CWI82_08645 [Pseudidiomarina tainanensis]
MNYWNYTVIGATALLTVAGCQSTEPYQPAVVTNVVEVSASQQEIYTKARQWFSEYFVSGESVIDYEDAESGTIIGNGITTIGVEEPFGLVAFKVDFTMRVDTKDGKFKAEYKINKHLNVGSGQSVEMYSVTEERKAKAKKAVEAITADLRQYIDSAPSSDDW